MPHSLALSRAGTLAAAHGAGLALFRGGARVAELAAAAAGPGGHVDALAFAPAGDVLVGIDHVAKAVVVWDAATLAVRSRRVFPKRPSTFAFVPAGAADKVSDGAADKVADGAADAAPADAAPASAALALFVGDKFGDVYEVPLLSDAPVVDAAGAALAEPVLGHVSMLLKVAAHGAHVLTADRDEHVRLSRRDRPYVIDAFLFGHAEYVAQLLVAGDRLVSGGGDPFLLRWDLPARAQTARLDLRPHVDAAVAEINVRALALEADGAHVLVAVEGAPRVLRVALDPFAVVGAVEPRAEPVLDVVAGDAVYLAYANALRAGDDTVEFAAPAAALAPQNQLRKQPEH